MSTGIIIHHVKKIYGGNTVIPNLSLMIENGEFFTFLGPSGCGKTTLLRMIAGFNSIEGGEIFFNEKRMNQVDPGKRNIGMVFQNYAIFPNMSVRQNVEFGLKNKKLDKEFIRREVDKFLKLVHVEQYADRRPDQLSGGQQQRVALARALVMKPDVLLMDEPLSNLDAKLRVEMRSTIKDIQEEVGITTVYVTHDQEEAMAVSDRIAVMNDGVIHHCGTPQSIYQRPADLFVASFIGKSNLIPAKLVRRAGKTLIVFPNGYEVAFENIQPFTEESDVIVAARPEELQICKNPSTRQDGLRATIKDSVFLGLNTHYFVELETGEEAEVIQESEVQEIIRPGSSVLLTLNAAKVNIFDSVSEKSIMLGVESSVMGSGAYEEGGY